MLQRRNAKRASAAENSELMEKHLLLRVTYSRNFFFPLSQNTCDLFILFHMGQFLGKSCVRGDGLCSTRSLQSAGLQPWSRILAAAKGAARPSPAAPLLTQHSLCLHSLHMGTSVFFFLWAFSSPKPPQVISSDIKGVNQVWETSLLILPE